MSDETKIEPALSAVEWRAIEGYAGLYEASSDGRVRRVAGPDSRGHHRQQRVMRPAVDTTGYLQVALSKDGQMQTLRVHRLVAHAFLGPCPDGFEVNHIDGTRLHNDHRNLEYLTPEANQRHATASGLRARGERNGAAKLTAEDVKSLRELRASGASRADVARVFGIKHLDYVTRISSGKVWSPSHLPPEGP